ncbi:MAG: hypothetical protein H7Z11_22765 [Verrucomicrobia bacterium]|nr:hypothetical protein [Leptolyngbya sp. ES-bin-22]
MTNLPALKQLPAPLRSLIRPMFFAAIGLHALLLFTPLPSEQKPKKADDKENPVKITQLPTAKPASRPRLAKPSLPKITRPRSSAAPAVAVPRSPTTPSSSDAGKATDTTTKDPFADFPHYPGSVPNYQGIENLRVASGASLASVVAHFRKELPDQKFTLSDESEPNTFKVSKGGVSYFLSVIDDGSQIVYLLGAEKLDKDKLAKIKKGDVVGIPKELGDIAKELDTTYSISSDNSATSLDVVEGSGSAFFKSDPDYPSNEVYVDGISETRAVGGQSPAQVYQALQPVLKKFDSANETDSYGGGALYELKKGKFTGYLSLVPGRAGGTVAVVWTKRP